MADEGAALQQTIKTESIPHHPGAALSVYTGTAHGNIKKENLQQSKAMGTIPGSDEIPLQRKSKSSTQRARDASVRNSNPANLPGLIGGEITYTPTTHRISKAKKGKKVHGCTFPGCTKVGTYCVGQKRNLELTCILDLHQSRAPQVSRIPIACRIMLVLTVVRQQTTRSKPQYPSSFPMPDRRL